MKVKHGYRFVSAIPKEVAEILNEGWSEFATKRNPGKEDRAKNMTYKIKGIGTVTLSLQRGSLTIDTDMNEETIKKHMKGYLSIEAFQEFCRNITCIGVGAHFTKRHGTAKFVLDMKKPATVPISITARTGNIYDDVHVHFKLPHGSGSIKDYNKYLYPASIQPRRKNYSDIQLLGIIRQIINDKKSVTSKDLAHKAKLNQSSAYRRLEKFHEMGVLSRTDKYPAIYVENSRRKCEERNVGCSI